MLLTMARGRTSLPTPPAQAVGSVSISGNASTANSGAIRWPRFNGESINIGAGDFTVEAWIRVAGGAGVNDNTGVTPGANYSGVFANLLLDSDRFELPRAFTWGLFLGELCFACNNANGTITQLANHTDIRGDVTWHHVAVCRTESNGLIEQFLDGVRVATGTGPTGDLSHPGGTGGAANDRYHIWGKEKAEVEEGCEHEPSEIRFSNSARYSGATYTVPTAPFTTDANTVGLFHLDENTGTIAGDGSGDANDGTLIGSPVPTWSTSDPF